MMNISILLLFLNLCLFFQVPQPEFKGGRNFLFSFIKNNLIYPEYSKSNCLQGTVNVSFKLNKSGKIYQSEVTKGFLTDLDDEALRIVRLSSGRWNVPAGFDTSTALVLPVNFSLKNYSCDQRSKEQLNAAIGAYHARTDLTRAIFNFYDKKASGEANASEEDGILNLKAQLGYDEKYMQRLFRQAERKIKQGDFEGGCEDLNTVRRLGSDLADAALNQYCNAAN